jgi:oligosaccharide reducing-end xylanase
MKATLILALLSIIAAFQVPPDYEVAPWHSWKQGVVTYSFDDGCGGQLKSAVPLLNKYGLHATFNVVTNWVSNWDGWRQAAQNGHEIASHTVSHANLNAAGEWELSQSKKVIEQNVGQECVTIVYPNCVTGNKQQLQKYYISGRTCSGQFVGNNVWDMFEISSFIMGNSGRYNSAQALNQLADNAASQGKWAIYLFHGVDNDGGYSPISSYVLDQHFSYVKQQDKVWVATMKEVSKYILEYKSLVITESGGYNNYLLNVSCQQSSVTKLDQPITIARKVSCSNPTVKRNGSTIWSGVYNGKVVFDVVPGNSYSIQC